MGGTLTVEGRLRLTMNRIPAKYARIVGIMLASAGELPRDLSLVTGEDADRKPRRLLDQPHSDDPPSVEHALNKLNLAQDTMRHMAAVISRAGGDLYLLANIVHDWPDAEALAILSACHRAMAPGARLWVIEQVLPPEDDPDPSERAGLTLMDLNMLVLFGGGQQRTGEEYGRLLGSAGFDEIAVVPAEGTPWSVVEAVRR
jgi:hypothetical protein